MRCGACRLPGSLYEKKKSQIQVNTVICHTPCVIDDESLPYQSLVASQIEKVQFVSTGTHFPLELLHRRPPLMSVVGLRKDQLNPSVGPAIGLATTQYVLDRGGSVKAIRGPVHGQLFCLAPSGLRPGTGLLPGTSPYVPLCD